MQYTHTQFLSARVLHALLGVGGRGGAGRRQWRGSKGADSGEGDVERRERTKTVGKCALLFPEHGPGHLPSSTTCVKRQEGWQWSDSAGWWSGSFCLYSQGLAGLAACSLGSCFLPYLCGLWGIHKGSQSKTRSRQFGAVCPLPQHLLTFQLGACEGMGLFEWLGSTWGNFLL